MVHFKSPNHGESTTSLWRTMSKVWFGGYLNWQFGITSDMKSLDVLENVNRSFNKMVVKHTNYKLCLNLWISP
jgi:hypothetical protein